MGFAIVQHVAAKDDVGSANGAATISAAGAGHILIGVWGGGLVAASVTDPGSYTRRGTRDNGGNKTIIITERIAAGGETSVAFTHASAQWNVEAFEFSGNEASGSEFDQVSAGAQGTNVTALQPGSITPGVADCLFIAVVIQGSDNGGTEAVDSGFTQVDAATFIRMQVAYKIVSGSGAENPNFTWTNGRNSGAIMCTFKPLVTAGAVLLDREYPRGDLRGALRGTI